MTAGILRLHEVGSALHAIAEELLANGGEITPEIGAALESLEGTFTEKIERLLLCAQELRLSGNATQAEMERLAQLARPKHAAADRITGYVKSCMEAAGVTKVVTDRIVAKVVKNSRPAIAWTKPTEELPELFRRVVTTVSMDGNKAYEALKSGESLPDGFVVEHATHLRVR